MSADSSRQPESLTAPVGPVDPPFPRPSGWRLLVGPRPALGLVLLVTLGTRLAWLYRPDKSLIFDEAYYVNAARRLLGWSVPKGSPYATAAAGLDPNSEHPPLGKVLIAASMRLFGDNPWGWRVPSVIAGLVVVLALYLLVRSTGHSAWMGVYAAGIGLADNLLLVHSRIATLDVLFLAPLLVGAVLLVRRHWWWAGALCGVAVMVKVPASFGVLGLVLFVLLVPAGGSWWERLRHAVFFGGTAVVVMIAGLWVLDLAFTTYNTPFAHLHHISTYGLDLSRTGGPVNSESEPWQWLSNDVEIPYLRVNTNEVVGGKVVTTKPVVFFRGSMNPALSGIAITALFYAGWRWLRRKDLLACWAVLWSLGIFVPFVALAVVSHRISYLFYSLPLVPAYAVAIALLLWHEGLPRICRWGFAAALLVGFVNYFPFRTF